MELRRIPDVALPIIDMTDTSYVHRDKVNVSIPLGRAFLQEAYTILDWERKNNSLGQAAHVINCAMDIVPILPPSQEASGIYLSAGAISGVVIEALVAVTVIAGVMFFVIRHRRRKHADASKPEEENSALEEFPEDSKPRPDQIA